MAATPAYAATPRNSSIAITTANANRDGTGAVPTVFTAPATGSRVEYLVIKAISTTTQGMVRLFVHTGAAYFLLKEVAVDPITPSATLATFERAVTFSGGLMLPSGYSIRASTEKTETFHVTAVGGDF